MIDGWKELSYDLRAHELTHDALLGRVHEILVGRDALIKVGLYAGRRARITGAMIDGGGLRLLAQPYRRAGRGGELLWDHNEARSYRTLAELELL